MCSDRLTTPTFASDEEMTSSVCFPNGVNQDNWWPRGDGHDFTLGPTMQPLAALKDSLQVISGLDHRNAEPGRDGAGDTPGPTPRC